MAYLSCMPTRSLETVAISVALPDAHETTAVAKCVFLSEPRCYARKKTQSLAPGQFVTERGLSLEQSRLVGTGVICIVPYHVKGAN